MRIRFCIQWRPNPCLFSLFEWREVGGELLSDIAPHLAHVATFAIHYFKSDGHFVTWRVSNLECGLFVCASSDREVALKSSAEKLAAVTPEHMKRTLRRVVESSNILKEELAQCNIEP